MDVEWTRYDRNDKENTTPNQYVGYVDELVWVCEAYHVEGVGIGYFDGVTFRMSNGSDDCHVTHWAPIEKPEPPADFVSDHDEEDPDGEEDPEE